VSGKKENAFLTKNKPFVKKRFGYFALFLFYCGYRAQHAQIKHQCDKPYHLLSSPFYGYILSHQVSNKPCRQPIKKAKKRYFYKITAEYDIFCA